MEDDTCQYLLKEGKSSCCVRQGAKLIKNRDLKMFDTPPLILIKILFAYLEVVPRALEAFMDGGNGAKKKSHGANTIYFLWGVGYGCSGFAQPT